MKIKRIIILTLSISSLIFIGEVSLNNESQERPIQEKPTVQNILDEKKEQDMLGRFQKVENESINKEFDGYQLSPVFTIAKEQESFNIELKGLDENSKVILSNPISGEKNEINSKGDGVFYLEFNLENDINYSIVVDSKVMGFIRATEDLENDASKIYDEITERLGCAL